MSLRSLIILVFLAAITHWEVRGMTLTTTTTITPTSTSVSSTATDVGTTTCITFDFPTDGGTMTDSVPTATEGTPTQTIQPSESGSLLFTCSTYTIPATASPTTTFYHSASISDAGTTTDPVDVPSSPTPTSTSRFVTYTVCTVSDVALFIIFVLFC
ncbi:hypothetical protein DFH06DRAFT_1340976 [Mycena polygramma]|nr:hypothetical protein DFH06DRAFT_1340976 [Mycena polygramma]